MTETPKFFHLPPTPHIYTLEFLFVMSVQVFKSQGTQSFLLRPTSWSRHHHFCGHNPFSGNAHFPKHQEGRHSVNQRGFLSCQGGLRRSKIRRYRQDLQSADSLGLRFVQDCYQSNQSVQHFSLQHVHVSHHSIVVNNNLLRSSF